MSHPFSNLTAKHSAWHLAGAQRIIKLTLNCLNTFHLTSPPILDIIFHYTVGDLSIYKNTIKIQVFIKMRKALN